MRGRGDANVSILVTGISGMLGSTLVRIAREFDDGARLIGTYRAHPVTLEEVETLELHITDPDAVADTLDELTPEAVIHLAAMTNTSACERDQNACQAVNVEAAGSLAGACAARDIALVFASTDLVFAGNDAPYAETDAPDPVNAYGRSKAEAEPIVLEHRRACVCRLPLLYGQPSPVYADTGGKHGGSFLQGFLETLESGEPMHLFTDEFRTMASAKDAAMGLLLSAHRLLEGWSADPQDRILHLGGPERLSRFDFGALLCQAFDLDPALIRAGTQAEANLPAPRPPDVSLSSERAKAMGYDPRPAANALASIARGGD